MCPAARQLLLTALLVAVAAAGPLGGVGGEQVDRPCVPRDFGRGSVVCVCNATYCDEVPRPARSLLVPGRALVYTSSVDGLRFQRRQRSFTQQRPVTGGKTFEVTSNQRYQSIIGWGASLTDSAGINIQALSKAARKNLIRAYFSEGGIEYNLIRVPIGGTDCSTHKYTLHDVPGDQTLANFSLAMEDYKYKLPVLKSVRAQLAAGLQLLGSAWTAPPWMKTNNDYTGFGFLKEEYYQTWADYHVKFLDAYREHGFSFWGLTTGNEPMNGVAGPLIRFNSMGWTPFRMREWIADNLGPTVRAAGSPHANVRILTLDDQRIDLPWWVDLVMANENASKYTDGVAVHWYTNYFTPVLGLDLTHSHFPDKFILSTEASNGFNPWDEKVILGSWDRAEGYFDDILDNLNHWVTGWMEWSLVLDTEGGPSWSGNLVDTSILVNATADEFLKQPTFYAIGHFSKFLPPGSRRVLVEPERAGGVRTVAFIRKDGITVVVLFNTKSKKETINIYDVFQGYLTLTLPPRSFNTVLYK